MVVVARLLRLVSVGAGVARFEGGGDGVEAITHAAMAEAAHAGRISDIGGAGGAGETIVGESGRVSDIAGSVSSTMASCVDDSGRDDSIADGGVAGVSGVARLERGERRSSLSSSGSCSSSASLRCLLTCLAGGEFASGCKRDSGVTGGVVHNRGAFLQAGTTASEDGGCGRNGLSVAARSHRFRSWRRRHLPAVAVDVEEIGRVHVKMIV